MSDTPFEDQPLPFLISDRSPVPPYEQIRGQLTVMVSSGRLLPNTRLPTIRALAARLDLAPGTVARAYRELEADGTIVGQGRRGTFVASQPPESEAVVQRRSRLRAAAFTFHDAVIRLGVDEEEAVEAIRAAFGDDGDLLDPDDLDGSDRSDPDGSDRYS